MNVLLKAKHGVGKTSIITTAFKEHNIKYLYFSGATLDPWVDFVGVPKEFTDENGITYLDLVRPKPFAYDDVEAIFIDELNRSSKKVRNSIMELLQFKSINGKKFNNLRFVWAAVNPPPNDKDDDEDQLKYQTEEFDPAQEDRFQVIYDIPYKPYKPYFVQKYGTENAEIAISWWNALNEKQKNMVSPRRLDLALDYVAISGDLRDVLPKEVNIKSLAKQLIDGSFIKTFNSLIATCDNDDESKTKLATFLDNPNVISELSKTIKFDGTITTKIANVLSKETLFKFLSSYPNGFSDFVINNDIKKNSDIMLEIFESKTLSSDAISKISKYKNKIESDKLKSLSDDESNAFKRVQNLSSYVHSTQERKKMFVEISTCKSNNSTFIELLVPYIITVIRASQVNTIIKWMGDSLPHQQFEYIKMLLTTLLNDGKVDECVQNKIETILNEIKY